MKRSLAVLLLTGFCLSFIIAVNAQDYSKLSLSSRLKIIETKLIATNKIFKILGENNASENGKIVQKITSGESFELLAIPLIENSALNNYSNNFTLRLLSEKNTLISEISSKTGLTIKADIDKEFGRKKRIFEFINPNDKCVKVRFYFIQEKK